MTTKQLSLKQPPALAVAANDTTPAGGPGAVIWSTVTNSVLTWDGSKWAAQTAGASVFDYGLDLAISGGYALQ